MILIVTGLPRTGTSMMMQMLKAAGMPINYDDKDFHDIDNPRGYLELDSIKDIIKHHDAMLKEMDGKATKIISQWMLAFLSVPLEGYHVKVICMQRDLREVLRSQAILIERRWGFYAKLWVDGAMADAQKTIMTGYRVHMHHIGKMLQWRGIDQLRVDYSGCLEKPYKVCEDVLRFSDIPSANLGAMVNAIDQSLYRVK